MKKSYGKPQFIIAKMQFEEHVFASGQDDIYTQCHAGSHWMNYNTSDNPNCKHYDHIEPTLEVKGT